jgi:hypothetical protein
MQVLFFIVYLALGFLQITAFLEGTEVWLHTSTIVSLLIGFVTISFLPFGSIATSAIAFYGAYRGWHWAWWQAALVAFPFAIFSVVMAAAGMGVSALATLGRQRTT